MKKYKISLIFNIIITILVIIGTIFMLAGIKIMGKDIVLANASINAFKYFTVDSNLLMGISAIIFAYYDYLVITKKKKEIPLQVYALKHVATVSVLLTFIVTLCYLAPFSEYEFLAFYRNSNLFFHLIVPLLSAIVFILYEKKNQDISVTKYGVIPMALYSIFYIAVYVLHFSFNSITDYDWYKFMDKRLIKSIISIVSIYLITYLISYAVWIFNKRNYKK